MTLVAAKSSTSGNGLEENDTTAILINIEAGNRNYGIHENTEQNITGTKASKLCRLALDFTSLSFQTTVICGLVTGMVATLTWWLDLQLNVQCFSIPWQKMPLKYQRIRLTNDVFEAMLIQLWTLISLAPTIPWSMMKELNLPLWNAIASFIDVISRLLLFVYGQYGNNWHAYVGNVIFFSITFLNHLKVANACLRKEAKIVKVILLACQLGSQFIFGFVVSMSLIHAFLPAYKKANSLVKTIMCSALPVLLAIPRLIVNHIIGDLPINLCLKRRTVFTLTLQVCLTMVARLLQADSENIYSFLIISFAHAILNVIDKFALPLRKKITNFICKCRRSSFEEKDTNHQYLLADQALISMITETSSVVLSCSAVYITSYYFGHDTSTGQRYNGFKLFAHCFTRVGIAVSIDFLFNIFAIMVQISKYDLPIKQHWKTGLKFILAFHCAQVILAMLYFSGHINEFTVPDRSHGNNRTCAAPFSRV